MHLINKLRKEKNWTLDQLSLATGISKRQLSAYEANENDIPLRKLQLIASKMGVKTSDLIKENDGDEEKKEKFLNLNEAIEISDKIKSISRPVPVFDQYAYATPVDEWGTPDWLKERQFIPTMVPEDGYYYWFPIKGDSMSRDSRSTIEDGDYVLGRELYRHYWKYPMQLHRVQVWIIIAKDRPVMCKEIIRHNPGTGIITCHSWNPYYQDEDFDLHLDDVIKLYYFKELKREKL